MTINLSELAHIKVIVPNAEEAYQILLNIFGAEKIKEDFVNSYIKVVYVGIGDFILQYIEPIADNGPWYDHLQTKGPGVYSLAFGVENIKETVEMLEKEGGIAPLLSIDMEEEKFPVEFLNPKIKSEYIMNTMEILGFNLELGEKSSDIELTSPKTLFVTGRDNLIGDASTMLHIELVTPNGEKTYKFLRKMFRSKKVEKLFSSLINTEVMPIVHVNLSNVVLQYCQPTPSMGTWANILKNNGVYVHNLNFLVDDIEKTVAKYREQKIRRIFKQKLTPDAETHYYMMRSLNKLGFHMEHGETPAESIPPGFLFTDYKKESKK
jgi:catechol 2,3-dioxygenase-like lactoylglutathione lyase family enzyme